jgi:hypothetical protein
MRRKKRSWMCMCGRYFLKAELCQDCGYCPNKCCICEKEAAEPREENGHE